MKTRWSVMLILSLTVLLTVGTTLSANGQEKAKSENPSKEGAGFTISRLVVGTGIENREPTGVAESFPASTEKVFCFLDAKDISKEYEISFVWFNGQTEMRKTTLSLKAGKRWRTFADKNLRGLKGDWKVEIRDGSGSVVKDVKFKVE
jgi:hypothetical protein